MAGLAANLDPLGHTAEKPNRSHRVNKSKPFVLAKMANREQVLETTLEESEDSEAPLSMSSSISHMYSGDRKGERVNSLRYVSISHVYRYAVMNSSELIIISLPAYETWTSTTRLKSSMVVRPQA